MVSRLSEPLTCYRIAEVPSVLLPIERNIVINPAHRHCGKIQVTESAMVYRDPRLLAH